MATQWSWFTTTDCAEPNSKPRNVSVSGGLEGPRLRRRRWHLCSSPTTTSLGNEPRCMLKASSPTSLRDVYATQDSLIFVLLTHVRWWTSSLGFGGIPHPAQINRLVSLASRKPRFDTAQKTESLEVPKAPKHEKFGAHQSIFLSSADSSVPTGSGLCSDLKRREKAS